MSAQDRLAAIVADHDNMVVRRGVLHCWCGAGVDTLEGWHAHVAAVIASSDDLAVVELPKLKPRGSFGARAWNATFTEDDRRCMDGYDSYAHVEVDSDGLVELDTSAEDGLFADEAEQVAAALLAAAKAAEGVSDR